MNDQVSFFATAKGLVAQALSKKVRLWMLAITTVVMNLAVLLILTFTVSAAFFFVVLLFGALSWVLIYRLDKVLKGRDDDLQPIRGYRP